MNVQEIMTSHPVYGTPDTSLHVVAQMMVENDCGCIPIVENNDTKKPVGMITDRDIVVRTVAENDNPLHFHAKDIMTENIAVVSPATSVEECCEIMEARQIRRIAVVDENGALCGMVSQADIAGKASNEKTAEVLQQVSKTAA